MKNFSNNEVAILINQDQCVFVAGCNVMDLHQRSSGLAAAARNYGRLDHGKAQEVGSRLDHDGSEL